MSEFHYTRNGQQLGPVTAAELKRLASTGELQPTDMIWKDGMPDWVPATRVKGLFASAADADRSAAPPAVATIAPPPQQYARQPQGQGYVPPAAAQYPGGAQIAYYNPSQLGARTAQILKGHPTPTGPQTEWPLSDAHLAQLALAEKHRKTIRNGASLLNFFLLAYTLGAIGLGIATLLAFSEAGAGAGGRAASIATGVLVIAFGVCVVLAILSYFAKAATLRCRAWGAITFIVLISLSLLGNLISLAGVSSGVSARNRDASETIIPVIIGLIICGAFIAVLARTLAAIPRFRAAPVWAQEALVNAKL